MNFRGKVDADYLNILTKENAAGNIVLLPKKIQFVYIANIVDTL
jgi:hypothetical protein